MYSSYHDGGVSTASIFSNALYPDKTRDLIKKVLEKKNFTEESYARQRYFEERFLPKLGYSYTTPLPQDIIQASTLINYYNSIGDDTTVTEIKKRLKDKGYDLTDYNL